MKKLSGFTLVEVLAAIAIMSIFTTLALSGISNVVDDARFNQTQREMELIRAAIVGETQRLETGLRRNYGYLGDVGALPTTLAALSSKPGAISSFAINSSLGVGSGWKGPYLTNTLDQNYYLDAWGRAYVYTVVGSSATLLSYGADGNSTGDESGYNDDIELNIPSEVTTGRILGYVVKAQGDVTGADQVPFSGNAVIQLFYPNGTGGFASPSTSISAGNSGRYSFAGLPLGYGAVIVVVSSTPNQTLGPSLIEINKAATAAVPVAQDVTTIYGTTSNCTTSENFSIVSNSYSRDNVTRTIEFGIRYPADYNMSTFYTEQEAGATISQMTIVNNATTSSEDYRSSSGTVRSYPVAGVGYTGIITNSTMTLSSPIAFASNTDYTMRFNYEAANWDNAASVFYYQIGCKFIRAHLDMD